MTRELRNMLYEQVARIGKAASSPKRLELLELLAQGEKTVEALATEAAIDIRLASAHLRVLRNAHLVRTRREGKNIIYALAGQDVAALLVRMREVAEEHLLELKVALNQIVTNPDTLTAYGREAFLEMAGRGEVFVIDVRPEKEYAQGHLPFARSMPVEEILKRIGELPKDKEIVAYCRGPFCLLSDEAITLLAARGYTVTRMSDGVAEWQAAGLPVEVAQG